MRLPRLTTSRSSTVKRISNENMYTLVLKTVPTTYVASGAYSGTGSPFGFLFAPENDYIPDDEDVTRLMVGNHGLGQKPLKIFTIPPTNRLNGFDGSKLSLVSPGLHTPGETGEVTFVALVRA